MSSYSFNSDSAPNNPAPQADQGIMYRPSAFSSSFFAPNTDSIIVDGYIPHHPSHYYPDLFPPPTPSMPATVSSNSALADFYHNQIAVAQKWIKSREEWHAAEKKLSDATAAAPDAHVDAAAEADGMQEQERLDNLQRQRNDERERGAEAGDYIRAWDDLNPGVPGLIAQARQEAQGRHPH